MDMLVGTMIVVGGAVGGLMVMTLFFKLLNWIDRRSTTGDNSGTVNSIGFEGVLDEKTYATVHYRMVKEWKTSGLSVLRTRKTPLLTN